MNGQSIQENFAAAAAAMSGWELLAVLLAIAYLLLAMRERIECWYAAFVSTLIYSFLFWDVNLLMESALQVYYMAMAVYGWSQWRHHRNSREDLHIHRWRWQQHAVALAAVAVLVVASGFWLQRSTSAVMPYLDSFTTWASVLTTYMVARKVLENWLYWIVIDAISIYLYIDRAMYLTALLFIAYVLLAGYGYVCWYRRYQRLSSGVVKGYACS